MSEPVPLTEAQIESASQKIASAQTLDDIRAVVEKYSAGATRDGAVLYSGKLGNGVYSGTVAKELAEKMGVSIINDTPRGLLLANDRVESSIVEAATRIFREEYKQDLETAGTSTTNFIFGQSGAAPEAATSVERSLWGQASKEFAQTVRGGVIALVDNADPLRVFGRVELSEALTNPKITNFMGMSRDQARQLFERDGFDGIKMASQAQGETLALGLPESLRAAYPGAGESVGRGLAGDIRAAGSAEFMIATVGLDAAQTYSRASDLSRGGNLTAADSEIVRFATRNVGVLGGAALGTEFGAALGIESGPGAIVTGLIGGVVGALGGNEIAKWYDESKINNQTDHTGKTWSINPLNHEQWIHRRGRAVETADAQTTRELNFRATSTAAELAVGRPPTPQDPNRIPAAPGDRQSAGGGDWQRDATSGEWHRDIAHLAGRAVYTTRETASPARAKELDRASGDIVAHNLAQGPEATALRFQATYLRNGWEKFGPIPPALATISPDHLLASDGNTYDHGKDGRWTSKSMLFTSVASGALKAELDVTHATLQSDLAAVRPALEPLREPAAAPTHKLNVYQGSKEIVVGDGFEIHGTVHTFGKSNLLSIDAQQDGKRSTTLVSRQELLDATPPAQRNAVGALLRDGQTVDIKLTNQGLTVHAGPAQQRLQPSGRGVERSNAGPDLGH